MERRVVEDIDERSLTDFARVAEPRLRGTAKVPSW